MVSSVSKVATYTMHFSPWIKKSALLILQPPFRFNVIAKYFTDCIGIDFAFTVGKLTEKGFSVKLDSIKKILDVLDKRIKIWSIAYAYH